MFEKLPIKEKPIDKTGEPGEMYSKNTVKVYQTYMNKLANATGITTIADLSKSKNQKQIVQFIDSQTGDNWSHRVAYSAVFYSLGHQPKKDIKILYNGFQKWKKPE